MSSIDADPAPANTTVRPPVEVIAADIGGTNTGMQLARVGPGRYQVLLERRYDSQAYADFLDIARDFFAQARALGDPQRACFAMAGPVDARRGQVTNLPWKLDADALSIALQIPHIRLINDFQAVGYGIEALGDDDLAALQILSGETRPHAPCAVIGAGTGLGEGILVWETDHYEPLPTEGGHTDFAPTDKIQIELLRYLMRRYPHVSYERIVSGPGLVNLHDFLCERAPGRESAALREAMRVGDPAAVISEAALSGRDALASEALDLFISIYGAQAGNLALTCLPHGGLYVAGGIAPKIIDKLRAGLFVRSFLAKGRMASVLAAIPVKVILNRKVGMLGAGLAASRL
jgi:glucokinase